MTIWDLIVSLGIDSKKFTDGIDAAEGKAKSGGSSIVSSLANVGGAVVTGALAAAGAGVVALGGFLATSVKAASDAEDIQAQLGAVLKSTGGVAGVTADQVNNLAGLYGRLTKFEDDAIVSGENMLLTFTNIGSNVFPDAAKTMLDMSQAMGTDLKGSAIQLGKALNNPTEGITALTRVGVAFTDQQKKQIEALQKAGKMEEAQAIILKELQTEFGGAAVAAGSTFAGQLTILKNSFGNIQETVGGALLPVLTKLATTMSEKLADPKVQTAISNIATGIADFAIKAIDYIPQVIDWFKKAGDWLTKNQGVIVGIFAALGAAVVAWAATTITAMSPVIVSMLPVIAIMAAVGVAAYLLYRAWTENWGNIQQTVQSVTAWIGTIVQAFVSLFKGDWQGFLDNIKLAWDTAWNWIKTGVETIWPIIKGIVSDAVKAVIGFFTNTDWGQVGRDIAEGIAKGILSAIGAVADAAKALLSAAQAAGSGNISIAAGYTGAQAGALAHQYGANTITTAPAMSTRHGGEQYASGGSFVIPSRYGYEGYPLGPGKTASGGETVTVTPEGGGAGIDYNKLAIVFRDTLLQVLQ